MGIFIAKGGVALNSPARQFCPKKKNSKGRVPNPNESIGVLEDVRQRLERQARALNADVTALKASRRWVSLNRERTSLMASQLGAINDSLHGGSPYPGDDVDSDHRGILRALEAVEAQMDEVRRVIETKTASPPPEDGNGAHVEGAALPVSPLLRRGRGRGGENRSRIVRNDLERKWESRLNGGRGGRENQVPSRPGHAGGGSGGGLAVRPSHGRMGVVTLLRDIARWADQRTTTAEYLAVHQAWLEQMARGMQVGGAAGRQRDRRR